MANLAKTRDLLELINEFKSRANDPGIAIKRVKEDLRWACRLLVHYNDTYATKKALEAGTVALMLKIHELEEPAWIKEYKHLKLVVDNTKQLGGKEPPEGDTWLERLKENTVFIAKEKNSQNFMLAQFGVAEKMNGYSRLIAYINPVDPQGVLVDNTRFCNRFDMVEYYENDDDGDRSEGEPEATT